MKQRGRIDILHDVVLATPEDIVNMIPEDVQKYLQEEGIDLTEGKKRLQERLAEIRMARTE